MSNLKLNFDMHCHCLPYSTCAVQNEDQMINRFVEEGLKAVSVTNHNTVKGMSEIRRKCEKLGIHFIPGCEFTAQVWDSVPGVNEITKTHILGYYIDDNEELISSFYSKYSDVNNERLAIRNKVYSDYFNIDIPLHLNKFEVKQLLKENGKSLEEFKKLSNSKEFIRKYENFSPSIREVIELIHKLGGIAVLAHPFKYNRYDVTDEQCLEIVNHCIECGVDGIEVLHPDTYAKRKTDMLMEIVRKHNLVFTIGSDIHGPLRPGMDNGYFNFDFRKYEKEIKEIKANNFWLNN